MFSVDFQFFQDSMLDFQTEFVYIPASVIIESMYSIKFYWILNFIYFQKHDFAFFFFLLLSLMDENLSDLNSIWIIWGQICNHAKSFMFDKLLSNKYVHYWPSSFRNLIISFSNKAFDSGIEQRITLIIGYVNK